MRQIMVKLDCPRCGKELAEAMVKVGKVLPWPDRCYYCHFKLTKATFNILSRLKMIISTLKVIERNMQGDDASDERMVKKIEDAIERRSQETREKFMHGPKRTLPHYRFLRPEEKRER